MPRDQSRESRRALTDEHRAEAGRLFDSTAEGNAVVVAQLLAERGVDANVRSVQRVVSPHRRERRAAELATVRFETAPGHQMQIDFGEKRESIAGVFVRVLVFVAVLSYSRRVFVRAFRSQRHDDWREGRALVIARVAGGAVQLYPAFEAFCRDWAVVARACQPYRARTKGKTNATRPQRCGRCRRGRCRFVSGGSRAKSRRTASSTSTRFVTACRTVGCAARSKLLGDDEVVVFDGRDIVARHRRCDEPHQRVVDPTHFEGLCRMFGPPGVGKTHLAIALGRAVIESGFRFGVSRPPRSNHRIPVWGLHEHGDDRIGNDANANVHAHRAEQRPGRDVSYSRFVWRGQVRRRGGGGREAAARRPGPRGDPARALV